MLEYVFFEEPPRKQFQDFLTGQGLAWTIETGDLETLVVVDETGLDDDLAERIESMYDDLLAAEQAELTPSIPPPARRERGSLVVLTGPDGQRREVRLPQELAERVLTVITADELTTLAEAVARAVLAAEGPPR